jgi:hypothetical protein
MTAIRITNFGGIIPKLAERLLPENSAQMAANTKLASGELRPMRKAKKVYTPASALSVNSIFKAGDTWIVWPTADVSVSRAAIEGEARYCYTGDGVPKVTTPSLALPVAANGTPGGFRALGIPSPIAAPSVGHSGGVGSAVSRYYCYTFASDWFEESAPSPVSALVAGKFDGTWAITAMDAEPANTGDITALTYVGSTVTITTTNNHFNRVGDTITVANVSTVTNINGTWAITATNPSSKTMTFVVTGTPTGAYNNATDTTDTWTRQVPWGTCTKRLYRTAGTLSNWQLVAEGISGTSYNDTLTEAQILGDALESGSWTPPPVNLKGLVSLPNGSMAGYYGNIVYQSEPFQPHAWPVEYQRKAHFPIMGIAGLADGSVVIATEGMPHVLSGIEPATSIIERIEEPLPCLSSRSVCSLGDSVVYSTRGGLARVGPGVRMIYTAELFSDEDWYALQPESIRCFYTRGNLYMVSSADPAQVFIIAVSLSQTGPVVTAPMLADCLHVDQLTGRLFYAFMQKVYEFDPDDGVPVVQNWLSKEFVLPQPVNLGAAKINFSEDYTRQAEAAFEAERLELIAENTAIIAAGRANGGINETRINKVEINGSELVAPTLGEPSIAFVLYTDGIQRFYRLVTTQKPFRLPSGYKADTFSVRVMSNTHIRSIEIGETIIGLKAV